MPKRDPNHELRANALAITSAARATCGTAQVVALFGLQLLVAITDGVTLLLLVPVINGIQADGSITVSALGGIQVSVWAAFTALLLVIAAKAAFSWGAAVLGNSIRWRTADAMRIDALDALLHAQWDYLATQRRSHLVQNLTSDIMRVNTASQQLFTMTVGSLMTFAMAAVAVALSPPIGIVAVLAAVLVGLFSATNVRRSGELGIQTNTRIKAFGAAVTDSLASIRLIRSHEASDVWMSALRDEAADGREVQSRFARASASMRSGLAVSSAVGLVLLVGLGLWLGLPAAILIALVVVVSRMLGTVLNLIQQAQVFANSAPAVDRVLATTRDADAHHEQRAFEAHLASAEPPSLDHSAFPGSLLHFSEVSVTYPGAARPALDAVTFDVTEGSTVAVTGASGAGKSTLLDVVLALTLPTAGRVFVEGEPLANFAAWRDQVSYVPQEVLLIPGTVRKNLTWTLQHGKMASDEEIWSALAAAELADVVRALPCGLDTELNETAALSGGEKQRLTIARALLRDPRLLVLDEATSALDSSTEAAILSRLATRATTVLMVTHRPDLADRADLIINLRDGRRIQPDSQPAYYQGSGPVT